MVMLSENFLKVSFCNLRIIYFRKLFPDDLIEILSHLAKVKITRCSSFTNFLLPNLINARSSS